MSAAPTDEILIAASKALVGLEAAFRTIKGDMTAAQLDAWCALEELVIAEPTHTEAGLVARVRALAATNGDCASSLDHMEGTPFRMVRAMMRARDVAAGVV